MIAPPCREYCVIDLYDGQGHWIESLACRGQDASIGLDLRRLARLLAGTSGLTMLLRHGHPSGCAAPSKADFATTRSLATLAGLLGLRLHDHIIEAGKARFSFREAGLL